MKTRLITATALSAGLLLTGCADDGDIDVNTDPIESEMDEMEDEMDAELDGDADGDGA